jgi:hypothetical protein
MKAMDYNNCSNVVGEVFCKALHGRFLDKNNIVWKIIKDEWIGKRSVYTLDLKACWLEDTTINNVKHWWCGGECADYTEVFKRTKPSSIKSALKYHINSLILNKK